MHVQQHSIHRRPHTIIKTNKQASIFKRFGIISLCLLILAITAGTLLPGNPLLRAMAAEATPSQPTGLSGIAGNQRVTLTWNPATNATAYTVERTDLASGQVQQLPDMITGTSATITALAIGHWYRFSIIPFNETIQGTPSSPVEVRTTGFQGSYSNYYVLGDSYSSGEGAPPYSGVAACFRSINSYSYQLGLGVPTPVTLACSGAIIDDIDKVVQVPVLGTTQLQQLQKSPQGNSLITLTIGGNDVRFAQELEKCIFSTRSCMSRQAVIAQEITALEPRLLQVYQEIRRAAPGADIIALGYPLLAAAPEIAYCHNPLIALGLSKSEMTMIRQLTGQLNATIAQAATQAGILSATTQVEQAFAGHEVCTKIKSDEWINEITGLTNMVHGSFHPEIPGYLADALATNAVRTNLYQNGMVRT